MSPGDGTGDDEPPEARIEDGLLIHPKVKQNLVKQAAQGPMGRIEGIVLHQTHSYAAASDIRWFGDPRNKHQTGVHFIIDRGGRPYRGVEAEITQLVPLTQRANHAGKLRRKCLVVGTCEVKGGEIVGHGASSHARMPGNLNAIGIELVTRAHGKTGQEVYPKPSEKQVEAAAWLITALAGALGRDAISLETIYAHPEVSREKRPTEGTGFWEIVVASEIPILGRIVRKRSLTEGIESEPVKGPEAAAPKSGQEPTSP